MKKKRVYANTKSMFRSRGFFAILCFWFVIFPVSAEQKHIFDIPSAQTDEPAPDAGSGGAESAAVPGAEQNNTALPVVFPILIDKQIMGKGGTGSEILKSFLLAVNSEADPDFVRELVSYYVEEAENEGVDYDVAFAQMCLETGFLRFGGLVTPDMNNFCGLGAIGPGEPGEVFSSARIGVRAHIQHLKAYASDKPLEGELVDPRSRWVKKGSAPIIKNLAGTWAADRQYDQKIGIILGKLYYFREQQKAQTAE